VNEIARAFAHDPENVLAGEIDVCFDSLTLRCTHAASLLKWLHHDVCNQLHLCKVEMIMTVYSHALPK